MNKNLLILLILVLFLVGVLAYWQYSQKDIVSNNQNTNIEPEIITSDIDTSDWEVYRNEELGFEVKYPNDWYYREDGSQFSPFPFVPNNDVGIYVGITSINYSDYKEAVLEKKQGAQKFATDHLINLYDKNYIQLRTGQRRYTFLTDNNNLWSVGFVSGGEFSLDIYNAFLLNFKFID